MSLRNAITIVLVAIIVVGGFIAYRVFSPALFQKPVSQKVYKIGIIINADVHLPNVEGLKSQMKEMGYIEGANAEYIFRHTRDQQDLRVQYANEVVAENPDIIVLLSPQVAIDLRKKNLNIPIVFMDMDPKPLVSNPTLPEANITGVAAGFLDFAGKRLELLKEVEPSIRRVIVNADTNFPNYPGFIGNVRDTAKKLNVEIVEMQTKNIKETMALLPKINKKSGDAFLFFPGPGSGPGAGPEDRELTKKLITHLAKEKLPSINHNLEFGANQNILMSYGNHRKDVGKEAAFMVDQILKGRPIREIPVSPPNKSLVLEINLKTAKAIGITIPQLVLSRANKVYNQ